MDFRITGYIVIDRNKPAVNDFYASLLKYQFKSSDISSVITCLDYWYSIYYKRFISNVVCLTSLVMLSNC